MGKFSKLFRITLIIAIVTQNALAKNTTGKPLEFAKVLYFQPSIEGDIGPIVLDGETLLSTPFHGDFYLKTKFNDKAKDSAKAFDIGKNDLSQSERIPFGERVGPGDWVGVTKDRDRLLWLDGKSMRVVAIDLKAGEAPFVQTVVVDKIKPASDSRGEPTRFEVTNSRNLFVKGFRKRIDRELVADGFVKLPEEWQKDTSQQFLMATTIPGFPLVTVGCPADHPGYCAVERQCFVHGGPDLQKVTMAGLAVSADKKMIVLGDSQHHRLLVYKFTSCFHIPFVKEIPLPKQLKQLRNLMIDSKDRLWISSRFPDDYNNASVFVWDSLF